MSRPAQIQRGPGSHYVVAIAMSSHWWRENAPTTLLCWEAAVRNSQYRRYQERLKRGEIVLHTTINEALLTEMLLAHGLIYDNCYSRARLEQISSWLRAELQRHATSANVLVYK